MRKIEIDHLLENAVAKALNVTLPARKKRSPRLSGNKQQVHTKH